MRKLIASVALVTAVAVGGLAVAAVNPLQLVSAKSSSPSTTAADPATTTAATAVAGRPGAKLLDKALAGLVEKGTITKEQAAAVTQAVKSTAKEYLAKHPGVRKALRKGAVRKALRRGLVVTSAKAINIAPKDLLAGLKSGKSIAQIAQANGVEPQTVVTAIVKAADTKIEAAVKAGKITADRAAKIEQRLPALATKVVNRVPKTHS